LDFDQHPLPGLAHLSDSANKVLFYAGDLVDGRLDGVRHRSPDTRCVVVGRVHHGSIRQPFFEVDHGLRRARTGCVEVAQLLSGAWDVGEAYNAGLPGQQRFELVRNFCGPLSSLFRRPFQLAGVRHIDHLEEAAIGGDQLQGAADCRHRTGLGFQDWVPGLLRDFPFVLDECFGGLRDDVKGVVRQSHHQHVIGLEP
jgi:hypothetical protein